MPYEIGPTTAEHVIAATDAVLLQAAGCDAPFVVNFLDVPLDAARHALSMGVELGLLERDGNQYRAKRPFAIYLVTAREAQKAAVMRVLLEDYEPYRVFKSRLEIVGLAPQAAEQVKQLYGLGRHRDEIKDTLVNLGTYAQSLVSEGAGLFKVAEFNPRKSPYLDVVAEVAAQRATAETAVRKKLGGNASAWINQADVFAPLVTAYQGLVGADLRAPILHAGNAVESFLSQLAVHHGVNLAGATGINAKVDRIAAAGQIATKTKFILKYLGHVRNAADHGADPEIGQMWEIHPDTPIEYVHVAITAISAGVARLNGQYAV